MKSAMNDLSGTHAIVTGAASGIGHAVAADLANSGAGVTMLDIDPSVVGKAQMLRAETGGRVRGAIVDCGDTAKVREAVAAARAELGPVHWLVHSAGLARHQNLDAFTDEFYDSTFDVHVRGLFAFTAALVEDWRALGVGAVVAVTSPAAVRGQVHGAVYSAAKSAVIGFVRSGALELAPLGVRINAILPMAATPMTAVVRDDPAIDEMYLRRVPLGRWGSPEEIAGLCRFLLAPSGAYITGTIIPIDGGRTI